MTSVIQSATPEKAIPLNENTPAGGGNSSVTSSAPERTADLTENRNTAENQASSVNRQLSKTTTAQHADNEKTPATTRLHNPDFQAESPSNQPVVTPKSVQNPSATIQDKNEASGKRTASVPPGLNANAALVSAENAPGANIPVANAPLVESTASGDSVAAILPDAARAAEYTQLKEALTWTALLELPFPPALYAQPLLLRKINMPSSPEIKPVHIKKFAWEAGAGASVWKAGLGATAGVAGLYSLRNHWSVAAGVQLRYAPLASPVEEPDNSENVSVQYRYSFGLERTEWRRTRQSMICVELPVSARWQRGRIGLSAGVAPGLLLSVRNRVTQTRETTLGGVKTLDEYWERRQKSDFKSVYFSVLASAEYRILPRLGLAAQGNFRPGSILKPVEDIAPAKNFWYADLGLRWHF